MRWGTLPSGGMPLTWGLPTTGNILPTGTGGRGLIPSIGLHSMGNLERLIETCIELGYAKTLETMEISSGEISQRRARDVYGKYFMDAAMAELK